MFLLGKFLYTLFYSFVACLYDLPEVEVFCGFRL